MRDLDHQALANEELNLACRLAGHSIP